MINACRPAFGFSSGENSGLCEAGPGRLRGLRVCTRVVNFQIHCWLRILASLHHFQFVQQWLRQRKRANHNSTPAFLSHNFGGGRGAGRLSRLRQSQNAQSTSVLPAAILILGLNLDQMYYMYWSASSGFSNAIALVAIAPHDSSFCLAR